MKTFNVKNIPRGPYCYSKITKFYKDKDGKSHWKVKSCPFYSYKNINEVKVPWCNFLKLGGTANYWTEEEWQKVRTYYKTEEKMDKDLPLFLLWDQCKECGENLDDTQELQNLA